MDVLPSCAGAAGLLGVSSSHPFVFLARILQETCMKMQECTNGEILLAVTLSRIDGPGGLLLFASGFVDGQEEPALSAQAESQITVGVDSLVFALQQVAMERQSSMTQPQVPPRPPSPAPTMQPGASSGARDDGAGDAPEAADEFDNPVGDERNDEYSELAAQVLTGAARDREDGDARREDADVSWGARNASLPSRASSREPSPPARDDALSRAVDQYTLPSSFVVPGLTTPPPRILLPTGRGAARSAPPPRPPVKVSIPDADVVETVREVMRQGADISLRARLMEFTSLYKYVIDTLVKREAPDVALREKVNHPYSHLTPDALRGATVTFKMPGGKAPTTVTTPMFNNSHMMTTSSTLAVILFMKHRRDPFFLWLLTLFCWRGKGPWRWHRGPARDAEWSWHWP